MAKLQIVQKPAIFKIFICCFLLENKNKLGLSCAKLRLSFAKLRLSYASQASCFPSISKLKGVKCVTFGTKLGRANLLTLLTCSLTSQMNNTLKQVVMLTRSLAKSPIFCLIGCSLAHPGLYWHERWFRKRVSGKLKWPLFSSVNFFLFFLFRGDYFSTRRESATVLKF